MRLWWRWQTERILSEIERLLLLLLLPVCGHRGGAHGLHHQPGGWGLLDHQAPSWRLRLRRHRIGIWLLVHHRIWMLLMTTVVVILRRGGVTPYHRLILLILVRHSALVHHSPMWLLLLHVIPSLILMIHGIAIRLVIHHVVALLLHIVTAVLIGLVQVPLLVPLLLLLLGVHHVTPTLHLIVIHIVRLLLILRRLAVA